MWCLYTTNKKNPSFLGTNDGMLIEFGQKMLAAAKPKANGATGRLNAAIPPNAYNIAVLEGVLG